MGGGSAGPRLGFAVCLLLALALALSGTAVSSPALSQPHRSPDGALTIGHLFAIDSLSPFLGFTETSRLLYSLLYDSFFAVDE
ncbi:MAG: hypothetical protein ACT4OI_03950, partial [Methanobacteriota archaeon]